MTIKDLTFCLALAAIITAALFIGIGKQAEINERTYYDKELGLTVYAEDV